MLEAHVEKLKQEAGDMKRSLLGQNERIHQQEQSIAFQVKENEDLKHDNTVLYQKNIHNKERLDKLGLEVEELKHYIEGEKQKNAQLDNENRRLNGRIMHLEDAIKQEKERLALKERNLDDVAR